MIMVERTELSRAPSVLLAMGLVEPKGNTENPVVPVRLLNLFLEGVIIYKGTRVAQANTLEEGDSVFGCRG